MKRLFMRILLVAGMVTSLLTLSAVSIDDWDSTDWATKVTQFNSTPVANVSGVNGVTAEVAACGGSTVYIGDAHTEVQINLAAAYLCATQFTAAASGNVTCLKINIRASGNVKVGIYSDSSDTVGSLLNVTGSTAVIEGTNNIPITSTAVTATTKYWIVANSDTASILACWNDAGYSYHNLFHYKAWTYADAFPATGGTGWAATYPAWRKEVIGTQ